MFEQKQVLEWTIEIDREATQQAYEQLGPLSSRCSCLYCWNYEAACNQLPAVLLSFFDSLGINPAQKAEICELCQHKDGSHLYSGFYHVVGRIISGRDSNGTPDGPTPRIVHRAPLGEFDVGLTEQVSLVPDWFPRPVLQVEFVGTIPWVLDLPTDDDCPQCE
jgi:hypothetical protein